MSATTELLIEQIKKIEDAITSAKSNGLDSSSLEEELNNLRARFTNTVSMLNENSSILKG
jgi:uncharacterized phage protein gp47/JayE